MTFAQEILAVNRTNLEAANSRIMDVDIAEESTNFARYTILREAGLAVLAQANTSAQTLLRLLE
jgi:flagellin